MDYIWRPFPCQVHFFGEFLQIQISSIRSSSKQAARMRVTFALIIIMISQAMSAPQRFGFGGRNRGFGFGGNRFGGGRGNRFSPTQNCLGGNCQQNNQNVNFNSGFGGRGGGNGFNPTQNCVGGNCQQNNQNINFNNPLFGKWIAWRHNFRTATKRLVFVLFITIKFLTKFY